MKPSSASNSLTTLNLRGEIVGIDQVVPLLDGTSRPYIYLDNAASTPAFLAVKEKVDQLLTWYSSVHRGSGLKSLVSSQAYDRAHEIVAGFVGADLTQDCVIFGKNTTEAINLLAGIFPWEPGDMVVNSLIEHHSNDLPWRAHARVIHTQVDRQGKLDMDHLEKVLTEFKGKVRLVAITGASNVTGYAPPIHRIAEMAHQAGAKILVDAAQLAPHRAISMHPHGSASHLDFVCLSGHKMYAPYGGGPLVGPRDFFSENDPYQRGGGTIEVVTLDEVHWAEAPERDEAGSPNVIGAVSLAESMHRLSQIGMDVIASHEKELTAYMLDRIGRISGLQVYGSSDPKRLDDRLGVISFALEGIHHGLVAAILGFEAGIGVRNGCFCAHPYILHLLNVRGEAYNEFKQEVIHHDRRRVPGLVRVSFGCYNTFEEIDYLVDWLERILAGKYQGHYYQEKHTGAFYPEGYNPDRLKSYFDY